MTQPERDSSSLFDYTRVIDGAGFVLRSLRRHWVLAAAAFALVVGGVGAVLAVIPRTYRVETRLLVRFDPLSSSLAEPGRALADAETSPLRSALDLITARDNLVALIQRTDLLAEWSRHRAPALRVKDQVMVTLFGEVSERDRLDALVEFLRARLAVWYEAGALPNQGTVSISISWPDRGMAVRLVEAALKGYIDARHAADISALAEARSILTAHASVWRAEALDAANELRHVRRPKRDDPPPPAPPAPPSITPVRETPDPDVERLSALVTAKRRALAEMEDARLQTLADLQKRLSQLKASYTDRHPSVIAAQDRVDTASLEPPQIATLRQDAKDLEAELAARRPPAETRADNPPATVPAPRVEPVRREEPEDPTVESARARQRFALEKYQQLRARIDSTALDLEARRAAFKYRYTVVLPPALPKGPIKPHVAAVGAAAVVGGLAFAAFAAVFADVRAGRFVEPWQVERALDLPVLSELSRR